MSLSPIVRAISSGKEFGHYMRWILSKTLRTCEEAKKCYKTYISAGLCHSLDRILVATVKESARKAGRRQVERLNLHWQADGGLDGLEAADHHKHVRTLGLDFFKFRFAIPNLSNTTILIICLPFFPFFQLRRAIPKDPRKIHHCRTS